MIRARQREGIEKARQRGAYVGRKPAFSHEQAERIRERAARGESKADLAREFGVTRKTIYQYLKPPLARA